MHVEITEFFKHMIDFVQVVDGNNKLLVFFGFGLFTLDRTCALKCPHFSVGQLIRFLKRTTKLRLR